MATRCFVACWNAMNMKLLWCNKEVKIQPIGSMYGIFTYIWLIFMVNVGIPYMDPMGNNKNGENRNERSEQIIETQFLFEGRVISPGALIWALFLFLLTNSMLSGDVYILNRGEILLQDFTSEANKCKVESSQACGHFLHYATIFFNQFRCSIYNRYNLPRKMVSGFKVHRKRAKQKSLRSSTEMLIDAQSIFSDHQPLLSDCPVHDQSTWAHENETFHHTRWERSWGTLKCYLQHFETFHCANFLKLKAWSMSCSLKFDLTASNEEAVWQARYALSQSAGRGTLHRNKSWSWRLYGKHWLIGLSGARNAVRATRWTVWRECCLKQHACITFLSWTIPCEGNIYPGFSHISNL